MPPDTRLRIAAPVRLRFVLGERTAEVALPGEAPLVDVLPAILLQLGPDAADRGAEHDGWVVQRLGEAALDEERSAAELSLLDGETLYLLPRAEQMPPIDFDDLVDGVGEQARTSAHRWTVGRTRGMLLTLGATMLLAGPVGLWLGGPVAIRAIVAAAVTVTLLAAAGLVSRAVPDPQTGTLLAAASTVYAATAGWCAAQALAPHAGLPVPVALAVLAALVTLCAGLALVADSGLLFAGALLGTGSLAMPALLAATLGVQPAHAAAYGLVGSLAVTLMLPPAAIRLAGLELPLLPSKPEQLAEEIEPAPYRMVVERGAAGLAYLAALSAGTATAQILLGAVLIAPGGRWPMVFAVVVAALLLMRARHLTGTVPRWATVAAASALLLSVSLRYALDRLDLTRVAVLVPVTAVVAAALLTAAATLPGRRLRPYWGRAVDILEILTAVALLPLLGAVIGLFPMVRAWAS